MVITRLKVAEVIVESVPQLATQWVAVGYYENIALLQLLSIATSTLAIVAAELKFISIRRKDNFVSSDHPAIASLAPLGFFLLLALLIGTIGIMTTGVRILPIQSNQILFSVFVINLLTLFSSFLIFAASSTHKYFIVSRNLLYMVVAMASAVVNLWIAVDPPTFPGNIDLFRFFGN